jgi:hypothetical protein
MDAYCNKLVAILVLELLNSFVTLVAVFAILSCELFEEDGTLGDNGVNLDKAIVFVDIIA